MNDQVYTRKLNHDFRKVTEDIAKLREDSAAGLTRLEDKIGHSVAKIREGITTLVEDGSTRLSGGVEKLSSEAREKAKETSETIRKDVGEGLSQYNAKVEGIASKVPGDIGKKASKYPWVAVTLSLLLGLLLGVAIKPSRPPLG